MAASKRALLRRARAAAARTCRARARCAQKYSSWYSFTTGSPAARPRAPVDVAHGVAFAVLARAHELDGVTRARRERDAARLVAPAQRAPRSSRACRSADRRAATCSRAGGRRTGGEARGDRWRAGVGAAQDVAAAAPRRAARRAPPWARPRPRPGRLSRGPDGDAAPPARAAAERTAAGGRARRRSAHTRARSDERRLRGRARRAARIPAAHPGGGSAVASRAATSVPMRRPRRGRRPGCAACPRP